ncbi:MAG TPA: 1,4-alpha-glucan branching protein GlgB [Bryobacteraceae bacterium]|nr:1,4-alpha-glucan branching protein GlgB [Bryobacteraceae bacterium]
MTTSSDAILTDYDLHLLAQGTHYRSYEKMGAHLTADGSVHFAVWAPNAESVSVVGDFNDWKPGASSMQLRGQAGVWETIIPGLDNGACYKYHIVSRYNTYEVDKADPYAFYSQVRPGTASRVWNPDAYRWNDSQWMSSRPATPLDRPIAIYEVHAGSWMRVPEENNRWLTWRELAVKLADYVSEMGFTHVEFMPVAEHPFDGSWGYQVTGYYAPTSRFGTPSDFMFLVDHLHQHGIGVILDWVPGHFPTDEHGLGYFDGTHLYEHADARQGKQREWNTLLFNFGRTEVRNFLVSNALFWLDKYHVDGIRADAVASMLYLDYAKKPGDWIPNRHGGKENIDAIDFIRNLNERVYADYPSAMTIAEESTAWPMVSKPTWLGGLGFGLKWNMGWMHDTLDYMSKDPLYRSYHHNQLLFSLMYAFSENFVLPFSHDEVVYGKGSMIRKMPGDDWQRFANLRLLYGYMFGHPGKKLLFMGDEFGQWNEWSHDSSLDWHLTASPAHKGLQRWVRDLNTFLRGEPALYELDCDSAGFEWVDCNDMNRSVISFLRKGRQGSHTLLFVCNFTPATHRNYRLGAPEGGFWMEVLNGDAPLYGGSGQGNLGGVDANPLPVHGRPWSLSIVVPPLSTVVFKRRTGER